MPFDVIIGRDESDKKLFGKQGLVYIGKSYVKMGNYTSLSNPILLDVARTHVILVAGKRGSGKSYSLGAIAESLGKLPKEVSQNIASLIFDTMGIFWTMKFKNEKDKDLLKEWGLKPENVDVKVFCPFGYFNEYKEKGIPVDFEFAIKTSELEAEDWISLFNLKFTDPISTCIETAIAVLKEKKKGYDFSEIKKEIENLEEVQQEIKGSAISLFDAADTWKVFSEAKGIKIVDMLFPGETSIIDLSMYSSIGVFNIRALIIGLVSRKLFEERMNARKYEEIQSVQHGLDYLFYKTKREIPLVWIFIDEAHEFLVKEGETPASAALIQLLREGRQPGISMVMATQQPGKIHTDAMTQSDIVISHWISAEQDIKALNEIMQTYMFESLKTKLGELPKLKGSALILDDNSERIYPVRMRPRFTWHGGEAPTSIRAAREGRE
jgi:hypothetical protein